MTTLSRPETASVHIQFDDNSLLPLLFGAHDKHLARIEQQLEVSLASRGNHVTIAGPADAAETARTALRNLYRQIKNGESVNESVVDAAVRMAHDDAPGPGGGLIQIHRKRIAPRSKAQGRYIKAIQEHDMVFAIGPAGTGKTYLAVCAAVEMFNAGKIDRIILSRPAVEAGERLGFLPGDMQEKIDPYLRPLFDALHDTLPGEQVVRRIASGEFEVAPLAFMRGRTLSNAFVILDEAQNTTPTQMKMFLTRLGENSRMVITGDLSQVDLPPGTRPGLKDAVETLDGVPGIRFVRFSDADVVRPPLVARIIRAYDGASPAQEDSA
ncbi:MAG: PhoH family protein [Rhodospirillaceae bacterium]|nr:PhoH family protein [Rhodospirillaceae bacterium]MDD9918517.1 PhoH family protein [Rhodospirillaceae bacterium]MDD9929243.1 PhoH family protein [Rhodospirillaceae bacterium]